MNLVRPFLVAAALTVAVGARAQQSDTARPRAASDTAAVTPAADQERGIDAEIRSALFELASDRPMVAAARLEWLRTVVDSTHPRSDLTFLLAECYYRLGMGPQFRATAGGLGDMVGGVRYQGLVTAQLMLDAYRRGDDAAVRRLAALQVRNPGGDRGLSALVSGLSAYRAGDWNAARGAFAAARAAGGVYAPYGQYMEALTQIAGDTTHAAAALDALRPLTNVATGAFGDQVRLTAAEIAYEANQFAAAASYAAGVSSTSGLAAQALLTRAWALYRAGQPDSARAAFAEFAARFPNLPERDDARVMLGQAMLEAGRTADAEQYFAHLSDSLSGDVALMQGRGTASLGNAAQALVDARGAGLAFLHDPRSGKTLAIPDDADADAATILSGYAGTAAPPAHAGPEVVSVLDAEARADSLVPALGAEFPRRLLYAPATSPAVFATYAERADALTGADAMVVSARYKLQQQLDAQVMRIAALEDVQHLTASTRADLAKTDSTLHWLQDSVTQMNAVLDRSRTRIHTMLATQVNGMRTMAAENAHMVDSIRAALGSSVTPAEAATLATEARTAAIYASTADSVSRGLDAVVARQPTFTLRDSVGVRLARARATHDETERVLAADDSLVAGQLATLRNVESDRVRGARSALAQAEAARAAAATQMVRLVDGELRARAAALLAGLQHDREAADYGSANAAFFRAMEVSGATTPPGASGAPASASPRQ